MKVLNKIRQNLTSHLFSLPETDPKEAYDIWSSNYDAQPDNLMLALDNIVFADLIAEVDFGNKVVADVGCGTGRHWKKIYVKQPARIIGFDVSEGMLKILKEKFPNAESHKLNNTYIPVLESGSCDIIISTLALAHIKNIENTFTEWSRVLKPDGHIIITDYHPDTLVKGGDRTFVHNGKLIAIKNYIHPIIKIQAALANINFKIDTIIEKKIDETVKSYYEKRQALKVFERYKGTAIIYGAHITRIDAAK